jgi:Fe2+ or Zn2+ uptake regulation protein
MRQTRQRRQVWEAIVRLGGHCTAEQITAEVARGQGELSRSTVYRALEALSASGAVRPVRLGAGAIRYELAGEEHQHALCQVCEGVFHIEEELLRELERHLEELHRFRPVRTEVLVVGVCDRCARSGAGRRRRRQGAEHVHFEPAG